MTTAQNAKLAANPALAETVLSPREYRVGQRFAGVARMNYGKAIERMVREEIFSDPLLDQLFNPAGIGARGPDVLGKGPTAGLMFDITTSHPRTIAEHLARPYGQDLVIITYDRPTSFVVFPP
ncbi:MAG: hypothetical protein GY842_11525 [bacterium]|nr:hypothetical protein [bacterium]